MKNTLIAILVLIILVLGYLFIKEKTSYRSTINEWPETVPATPTNNQPNTNNNSVQQTQTYKTFTKDGTPLVFQYPSKINKMESQFFVKDGNYALYAGSNQEMTLQLMGIGFPDYNEIEVRDAVAYDTFKNKYSGIETIGKDGNKYFVAYGLKSGCGDMGVICHPRMIGVKKLPGNNYGFVNAFVTIDSTAISMDDLKNIMESITILNLPPAPGSHI